MRVFWGVILVLYVVAGIVAITRHDEHAQILCNIGIFASMILMELSKDNRR